MKHAESTGPERSSGRVRRRYKILVVDDNPGDVDLTREWLASGGDDELDVESAASWREAAVQIAGFAPDVIILDLNLPDSDGLETLRRVRRQAPETPVIVVSGIVDDVLRAQARKEGAEDVMSKEESNSRLFARSVLYVIEKSKAREEHRQMEHVLECAPDAILVVVQGGVVEYVNNAALALFNRRREDFVGELLGFSVKEGEPSEISIARRGESHICEMRVVDIQWKGAPASLASIRDVTEQRQLETQIMMTDRMVSMGTLVASLAHEINNPLASVLSNLELAQLDVDELTTTPPQRLLDELRDARDAASRVRSIVRDLRVYSRVEQDVSNPVDVHGVIESTLRMARNSIRHRARIVRDFCDSASVLGSESRVGQVLLNLVMNAAQAIREGDYENNEIRISTRRTQDSMVHITIADTGHGISEAAQRRVFSPFFTTKSAEEGTGLGLAICRKIVRSLGGRITFESQPGVGTRFHVFLPGVIGVYQPKAPQSEPLPSAPRPMNRPRVLVVDDERLILDLVQRVLSTDHDVVVAERATDALERIQKEDPFDVILCDLMMPQMTGLEFHDRLRNRHPGLERRIIFLSGGTMTDLSRGLMAGLPNARLEKPFDLRELRNAVDATYRQFHREHRAHGA